MSRITNTKDEFLVEMLEGLKLLDISENYRDAIQEAIDAKEGYKEFLARLAMMETEGRKKRLEERLIMQAGFEYIKTLDDIEYEFNSSINYQRIRDLGTLEFMEQKENIVIIGPPGVGKSMIATGIGINACKMGKKVLFVNAKEFIDDLYKSMVEGRLKEELNKIERVPLLIVDELSYLKMDKERESIFFQIVRQRYEKSSLIITTNLPLGRWDEVFTGQLAATAILDRLVHHCHVINITGDSFRVKGNEFLRNKEGA